MQNYRFVFELTPHLGESEEDNVYVPHDIFEALPPHTPQVHHYDEDYSEWFIKQQSRKDIPSFSAVPGKSRSKDWRFGPISIDWFDLPKGKKKGKKATKAAAEDDMTTHEKPTDEAPNDKDVKDNSARSSTVVADFESDEMAFGTTNLPQGIIRIFRDTVNPKQSKAHANAAGKSRRQHSTGDGTTLAVLAIPFFMTPADFLSFVKSAEDGIAHIRLIRDGSPSRSIALMKFRNKNAADAFGEAFNGREFLPTETEVCHVVRVLSIDVDVGDSPNLSFALSAYTPSRNAEDAIYELPTCPVCLERMDHSVTGLVTVPCSHTFHCVCLSRWGDSRCPVCRYSQNILTTHRSSAVARPPFNSSPSDPSFSPLNSCGSCDSHTNLWICLICGNVGCGRYGKGHAYAHYEATTHFYALELETQRVWDYAGDGYVHRLIHNKADGKVVELPSTSATRPNAPLLPEASRGSSGGPSHSDSLTADKVEAIGIEYSYLLASQLDSQRAFFEEQKRELRESIQAERAVQSELREQLSTLEKEKQKADQRITKLTDSTKRLEKEVREEKALSNSLKKNLDRIQEKADTAENERKTLEVKVVDLEEQVRDLMFYLQAKDRIEQSAGDGVVGELAGGSVVVPAPPPPPSSSSRRRRNK